MNWLQRTKAALAVFRNPLTAMLRVQREVPAGRRLGFETLEPRWALSHVAPGLVDTPQTYSGALNGKIVFTSPGHGWRWDSEDERFETDDRVEYNEIIEPFGTQDQLTYYADYLLRAGATVVPMRPVGRQLNEVVLDNDSPGVTFTGAWTDSGSTRYYDEDYGVAEGGMADTVPYRYAGTTAAGESSIATYTPNIPQSGFYPVYTWVLRGTDRVSQLYRIKHTGGTTEIRVDHSKVGSGWVYLGTYHFAQGSSSALGSVQISNNGAVSGPPNTKVVIADAIRFGNGMGDYIGLGAPTTTGKPREEELSYYWIARMVGVGTSLSTAIGSGSTNVSAPSNMAQYMFDGSYNAASNIADAVYIGIHSNGAGGHGARGLMTTNMAIRTPHQNDLALYLGRQINLDFRALDVDPAYDILFGAGWSWAEQTNHTVANQNFGEIDLGPSAEMDATIIEIAFHDTAADAAIMREPRGRDQFARSMLQGTIEYFQNHGSNNLANTTTMPTAPVNVRAVSNSSGQVTVNWSAGPTAPSGVYNSPATGFKIYASADGYGFDGGTLIPGGAATSATLSGYDPTRPYYFKVVALNAGGESTASEVLTVLPSGGAKQVLIVNGFDRFDRSQNYRYSVPTYLAPDGLTDHTWSRYNNSFDYVVKVHAAIHASKPGVHVASTSNEAVISGAVNLNHYDAVIWILGTESTVNDTFNATEQTLVTNFVSAGGHLFLSGSEIAWDLDQQNNGRTFFETTLKGNYVSDDAGTYTATAAAGGIFAGMNNFVFSSGASFSSLDGQTYNVAFPDVIAPQPGAVVALNYNNGAGAAAIQVTGAGGAGNIVMFGFPFETMTDATRRLNAMGRILDFFNVVENADFNRDAAVDAADFVMWAKTKDMTVAGGTLGDANYDTQVDNEDYLIWREQFGASPGAGGGGGSAFAESNSSNATPGVEHSLVVANATSDSPAASDSQLLKDFVFSGLLNTASRQTSPSLARGFRQRLPDSLSRADSELLSALIAARSLRRDPRVDPIMAPSSEDRAFESLSDSDGGVAIALRIGRHVESWRAVLLPR
jgi:hypothetical protein